MKKVGKKVGLLATKLGYDDNCKSWVYYCKEDKCYFSTNVKGGISGDEETFKQPTQSELQKWLRKKYKIEAYVIPNIERNRVEGYDPRVYDIGNYCFTTFKTYELAMESALQLALNKLNEIANFTIKIKDGKN